MADFTRKEWDALSQEEQITVIKSKLSSKYAALSPDQKQEVSNNVKRKDENIFDQITRNSIDALTFVSKQIDRVGGAPARAALGQTIKEFKGTPQQKAVAALNALQLRPSKAAVDAFFEQFGKDPDLAPSSKKIAEEIGLGVTKLSERFPGAFSKTGEGIFKFQRGGVLDLSDRDIGSIVIDMTVDPTMLVPVAPVLRIGGKAIKGGVRASSKIGKTLASSAVKAAEKTPIVGRAVSGTKAVVTGLGDEAARS